MSASLKLHCTVLRCVRQPNPTEEHRRQRTFAWAVAVVILTGSASLGQWISAVVTEAQAASTWRRLWRLMNNTGLSHDFAHRVGCSRASVPPARPCEARRRDFVSKVMTVATRLRSSRLRKPNP